MRDITIIFKREFRCFLGGEKGFFIIYLTLTALWGGMFALRQDMDVGVLPLFFAMFSVLVSSNFSNTVFVTERIQGSLEILLTSGVSRGGILFGKIAFTTVMTVAIGAVCVAVSHIIRIFLPIAPGPGFEGMLFVLFCAAAVFNAAGSAWFSVLLPNPRMLHFVNLLLVSLVLSVPFVVRPWFDIPLAAPVGALLLGAVAFSIFALREFRSDRIIKPVIL